MANRTPWPVIAGVVAVVALVLFVSLRWLQPEDVLAYRIAKEDVVATLTVTGEVRLRLRQGTVDVAGRTSPYSLYAPELASFTMGDGYNPADARGFINMIGLPIEARAVLGLRTGAKPTKD